MWLAPFLLMEPSAARTVRRRRVPISPESKEIDCVCVCVKFKKIFLKFELLELDEIG